MVATKASSMVIEVEARRPQKRQLVIGWVDLQGLLRIVNQSDCQRLSVWA